MVGSVAGMSVTQIEKAEIFRALHEGPGAFVIPNPWDNRFRPHSGRPWLPGVGHIERCFRLGSWPKGRRVEPG